MRVIDLFAGVGGFRLGLSKAGHRIVWWNQWEPATKRVQYAYQCYAKNFHNGETLDKLHNTDIREVPSDKIPDHDLLVGGFPCQDYSVAAPLKHSGGLRGKKGVLWWEINRILEDKKPNYVLLENVDRLLKSPKKLRGRDFSVLLASFARLKYAVEWRVINAADYGEPQRRRRVFIFAAKFGTAAAAHMRKNASFQTYLTSRGFFAREFRVIEPPATPKNAKSELIGRVGLDPPAISRKRKFPEFRNSGIMVSGNVWSRRLEAQTESPRPNLLDMLVRDAAEENYIPSKLIPAWRAAKQRKDILKNARDGQYKYWYNEGKIPFPDKLDQPARTLLTAEGMLTPYRSNHIIRDPWRKKSPVYRVLTPEECEKLMGFPVEHTEFLPRRWRYFTMGNAVMVNIVERIGKRITSFTKDPTADHQATGPKARPGEVKKEEEAAPKLEEPQSGVMPITP